MKWNPTRCLPLLSSLLMLLLIHCNSAAALPLAAAEREWIAEHPVLTIGNETDWPPFDYTEHGRALGYSIDLIKLIADKAGLGVEFVTGPTWSELLNGLYNGDIDVLPAIYFSAERQQHIALTDSYFSQPSVIVVKKNNQTINAFSDLTGKTVAGVEDFVITRTLQRDHPDIKLQTYPRVVAALKAVAIGDVDAYIDSIGLVAYALDNNFVPNLKLIGDVDISEISNPPMHMAVKRANHELLSILNKGLASVTEAERQLLAKRWFSVRDYEKRLIFTEEQARWIRQNPRLRVGLDPDYPPYSFVDNNGHYAGIIVDMLQLLSEKTSIEFIIQPGLQWQGLLDGIRNKTLDMAAPIVQTDARNEYMIFSQPIIASPLVIMTRSDNHSIKSPQQLNQHTVALVQGYSSSERVIRENPGIKKHWVKTPLEGLQAVSTGQADAFVSIIGLNIYLSQQHGINNLQVAATYDLHFDGQRFAIPGDKPQLAVLLNKALDDIKPEQRAEIRNRWIKIPDARKMDYSLAWKIAAIFSLIVMILYVYSRRLSREIRERRAVQQQLLSSNQQLTLAKHEADNANNSKSRFVTTISHELKTPLNAIIGFSDILQRSDSLSVEDKQYLQLIFEAGQHLNTLIEELLDLAKIESGKLSLSIQNVELQTIIEESLSLSQLAAEKRGIRIHNTLSDHHSTLVLADPTRLKQVLLNLLSNAIKYNEQQGLVEISCEQLTADQLRLSIRDTGQGIAADQQPYLFDYLERAGAESSTVKGTGIGLTLCKNLVELMGGKIGVESSPGQGATFWFTLNTAKP